MVVSTENESIRSLTSLQLVPPPRNSQNATSLEGEVEKWDPFPAPYAPHVSTGGSRLKGGAPRKGKVKASRISGTLAEMQPNAVAARDSEECRSSTSDQLCSRDGVGREGCNSTSISRADFRPPKISPPRSAGDARRCLESPRRFRRSSPDPTRGNQEKEKLIKVTPNGSVIEGRKAASLRRSKSRSDNSQIVDDVSQLQPSPSKKKSRSFSPMLTRGRVDQHLRNEPMQHKSKSNQPMECKSHELNKPKDRDVKGNRSPPIERNGAEQSCQKISSSSSSFNRKLFMVGASKVYSRTLVSPTIYHNAVTDNWIVTINSDSNSKNIYGNSVKAFSFRTEKEARASAYANSPPQMIPFSAANECMICAAKFTMFKRPRHCRNCGICTCSSYACCTSWPKLMIPDSFNIKKEGTVKICTSCNALAKQFQHALLNGRYGTCLELYLTGNINLRVPYAFKEMKERMFPIHCAIEGKSEKLLRWLVDVQHCPIHVISTGNSGSRGSGGIASNVVGVGADMIKSINGSFGSSSEKRHIDFVPTLKTSKGRSVMDIAMKTQNVGILRYLINEKNVSVYEVEQLELALGALDVLAKAFPAVDGTYDPKMFVDDKEEGYLNGHKDTAEREKKKNSTGEYPGRNSATSRVNTVKSANPKQGGNIACPSPEKARIYSHSVLPPPKDKFLLPRDIHGIPAADLYGAIGGYDGKNGDSDGMGSNEEEPDTIVLDDDNSVSTTVPDICIICQENDVDCVATPCGHQVCCLPCSNQCLQCPICNTECHFIEIYQP